MLKKAAPFIIVLLMGVVVVVIKKCTNNNSGPKTTTSKSNSSQDKTNSSEEVNRNRGFDRRTSYLEYTIHAKCRMDCRHITQLEVEDIMRNGTINYRKSDVDATPCPTYAIEGTTVDDQRVRIVFAQCDHTTKVVTCIDLNTEWECHCPGDDKKYQNKN